GMLSRWALWTIGAAGDDQAGCPRPFCPRPKEDVYVTSGGRSDRLTAASFGCELIGVRAADGQPNVQRRRAGVGDYDRLGPACACLQIAESQRQWRRCEAGGCGRCGGSDAPQRNRLIAGCGVATDGQATAKGPSRSRGEGYLYGAALLRLDSSAGAPVADYV